MSPTDGSSHPKDGGSAQPTGWATGTLVATGALGMLVGAFLMWATQPARRPMQAPTAATARPAPTAASSLPGAARTALEAGNAAFRKRDYLAALANYRTAVTTAPNETAPYFGIYMAAQALHDSALADSALRQIREKSGGAKMWSDSSMRALHGAPPGPGVPKT